MTREHKLALIIGFSLVLVVGVLISDHFSKARSEQVATEITPGTGPSFGAGTTGLRVVSAPTGTPAIATPPPTIITPPAPLPNTTELAGGPAEPPLTEFELTMDNKPVTFSDTARTLLGERNALAGTITEPVSILPGPGSSAVRPLDPVTGTIAAQPLSTPPGMPTDPSRTPTRTADPRPEPRSEPRSEMVNGVPLSLMKRHDVREGDTLYRIADRTYGDSSLWTKLAEFNKGKLGPNNSLRIGVTLLLPPKEALTGKPLPAATPSRAEQPPARATTRTPAPTPTARTYTVQKGDSLSEIARRTLGSARRWSELLDLNKDKLSDEDSLYIGMTIKLPAR